MVEYCVITQFPDLYHAYVSNGLPKRGIERQLFQILPVQLRDFTRSERKGRIDDIPYGGGSGMIVQIEPVYQALLSLKEKNYPVILMDPKGKRLSNGLISQMHDNLLNQNQNGFKIICGYYQGVDARIADKLVDYVISIGDFVLGSGDLAALVFIEAMNRLLPNYMSNDKSRMTESFSDNNTLEYPQYTRPANYQGWSVPNVLLSGNHQRIAQWRQQHRIVSK